MKLSYRWIEFRDLLSEPLTVDGIIFDATVIAVVTDKQGFFEIDSLEIKDVYAQIGQFVLKLDKEDLSTANKPLFKRFENAVELKALQSAKDAADIDWHEVFEEEVGA